MLKQKSLILVTLSLLFFHGAVFADTMQSLKIFVKAPIHFQPHIRPLPKVYAFVPDNYVSYKNPFTTFNTMIMRKEAMNGTSTVLKLSTKATPLERFSLSQLKLIGVVKSPSGLWGIVETPKGNVYKASVGTPIGMQNGHVLKIEDSGAIKKLLIAEYRKNSFGKYIEEKTNITMGNISGETR
jgi:type IV pilus assembly protein PilP